MDMLFMSQALQSLHNTLDRNGCHWTSLFIHLIGSQVNSCHRLSWALLQHGHHPWFCPRHAHTMTAVPKSTPRHARSRNEGWASGPNLVHLGTLIILDKLANRNKMISLPGTLWVQVRQAADRLLCPRPTLTIHRRKKGFLQTPDYSTSEAEDLFIFVQMLNSLNLDPPKTARKFLFKLFTHVRNTGTTHWTLWATVVTNPRKADLLEACLPSHLLLAARQCQTSAFTWPAQGQLQQPKTLERKMSFQLRYISGTLFWTNLNVDVHILK